MTKHDEVLEELREVCIRAESVWLGSEDALNKDALARYYQIVTPTVVLALIRNVDTLRAALEQAQSYGPVKPVTPTFSQTISPQRFTQSSPPMPVFLPEDWPVPSFPEDDDAKRKDADIAPGEAFASAPDPAPDSPSSSDASGDSSDFSGGGGDSGGGGASSDY